MVPPMRAFALSPLLLTLGFSACFESGPLQTTSSGLEPGDTDDAAAEVLPEVDTTDGPELELPDTAPDTAEPPDTQVLADLPDVADVTDTDTAPDLTDTAPDPDVPPLRSCLTHSDCADLANDDRCEGPIRCVDYGCRPDPSAAVVCTSADPCIENTCNPATGLCVPRAVCTCESPLELPCGPPATWPTSGPGLRPPFPDFGPCAAPSGQDVRILRFSTSGRVRLEANAGVRRFWLLDADTCDGAGCLGSEDRLFLFSATPGKEYAIAVEELPGTSATMTATCGITFEDRCRDGLDEDGDGLTDCDDRDCDNREGCVRPPDNEVGLCDNGVDDDSDGFTDCSDLDCGNDAACLQACEVPTGVTSCNFSQGLGTGGGKARSTNYSCNPAPQAGKEVVYKFRPGVTGTVRIGFSTSAALTLHLLRETGRGCTPRDCIGMATSDLWFEAQAGETYYAVIDAPLGVTGSFNIQFDCNPFGR